MDNNSSALNAHQSQCASLRIPKDGDGRCSGCVHYEDDPEVDVCNLHDLYHDWDQPESLNFVSLVCDDFIAKK